MTQHQYFFVQCLWPDPKKKKTFLMRLSKVNKQQEIYTFLWFRRYRTLQQLIGLVTPEELSVSFIRWLQKFLKGRVLSYCLTCLFACLPTHLFAYTDDRVMLSSFITGQSPQIIKIKNHMIFVPTSCNNVFFLIRCVFFSTVFFLLKKLGCVGVISFLIPRFFFLNQKALFPWMKWTITGETMVTKMRLTFLHKTLEN